VELSTEQRTRIRDALSANRDVPRVDRVDFDLTVGTVVPNTVRFAPVPEALIAIHPEWRGYEYFVVRDEVVILSPEHRILATVPVGTSSAGIENRGGFANRGVAFNGSAAEIREVQMALVREGFDVGEVDGVMGPRTTEALIAFQRRHGFQATGHIDEQTFAALRVNAGGNVGGNNPPATTGQGNRSQQPSGNGPGNAREPASGGHEPLANEPANRKQDGQQGANPPATTGQGSGQNRNNPSANPPQAGRAPERAPEKNQQR
jgi:hypothetical protein